MQRILLFALFLVGLALPAWADYDSGYRAYKKGDYGTALDELLPLAKQGDPKAQRVIAEMYADGLGVDEDYVAAAKWYQRAADQGYAPAMAGLGDLYFYGNGVDQNQATAIKWYRRGAERGDPEAEYDYGLIFHDGSAGQKQNFDAAMKWFLRAAAQGDGPALNMVGYMHDLGEGVGEDPMKPLAGINAPLTRASRLPNTTSESCIKTAAAWKGTRRRRRAGIARRPTRAMPIPRPRWVISMSRV